MQLICLESHIDVGQKLAVCTRLNRDELNKFAQREQDKYHFHIIKEMKYRYKEFKETYLDGVTISENEGILGHRSWTDVLMRGLVYIYLLTYTCGSCRIW